MREHSRYSIAGVIMRNTSDVGTQAYSAWTMVTRATQTGVDLLFHDPPSQPLTTKVAGPWWIPESKRRRRYARSVATQATVWRVRARTQTPQNGPSTEPKGAGRSIKGCRIHPEEILGVGGQLQGELEISCEVILEADKEECAGPGPAKRQGQLEASWEEVQETEVPPVEIPASTRVTPLAKRSRIA